MWLIASVVIVLLSIFAALVYFFSQSRDGDWHQLPPDTMIRFKDGKWENRPATKEEILDMMRSEAW